MQDNPLGDHLKNNDVQEILLEKYNQLYINQDGVKMKQNSPFRSDQEVFKWLQEVVFSDRDFGSNSPIENTLIADDTRIIGYTYPISPYTGFAIRKKKL